MTYYKLNVTFIIICVRIKKEFLYGFKDNFPKAKKKQEFTDHLNLTFIHILLAVINNLNMKFERSSWKGLYVTSARDQPISVFPLSQQLMSIMFTLFFINIYSLHQPDYFLAYGELISELRWSNWTFIRAYFNNL